MTGKIEKLSSMFRVAGYTANIDHFFDRLKIRKAAYIFQTFSIDLGYKFGFYVKGVYSPALADDYYHNRNVFENQDQVDNLTAKEKAIAGQIKEILDKPNALEAVSSVLYFQQNKSASSVDAAIIKTKEVKPYLTDSDFAIARAFLNKYASSSV